MLRNGERTKDLHEKPLIIFLYRVPQMNVNAKTLDPEISREKSHARCKKFKKREKVRKIFLFQSSDFLRSTQNLKKYPHGLDVY